MLKNKCLKLNRVLLLYVNSEYCDQLSPYFLQEYTTFPDLFSNPDLKLNTFLDSLNELLYHAITPLQRRCRGFMGFQLNTKNRIKVFELAKEFAYFAK